jgi:UDP:flavonoid glycosyltransferase YjiC (YdhE family)|tara:strand:- start:394 stop:1497 length:1104 start_codon:yes stop_codon:yes gene_type:complete
MELKRRGAEVMFSTYLEAVEFVRRQGFPVVKSPAISLVSDSTGRIDLKATVLKQGVFALTTLMKQIKAEMEYIKSFRPNIVVSDSRLSTLAAGKLLGIPVVLIINQFRLMIPASQLNQNITKIVDGGIMTMLSGGWGSSDVIIIPDFPRPYTICLDSLRIPQLYKDRVKIGGFILERKPEDVRGSEEVRKEAGASETDKLIYAAISGPIQEKIPLIKMLEPILERFPRDIKVVMSTGNPKRGSDPVKSGSLTVIPWVEDRYKYLKAADAIICRGGHNTIMQSICYSKPSIIIPTPNHTEQYANARRAKELGFAEAIHQDDVNRGMLLRLIDMLTSNPEYDDRFNKINAMGFTDGIENTLEAIAGLLL